MKTGKLAIGIFIISITLSGCALDGSGLNGGGTSQSLQTTPTPEAPSVRQFTQKVVEAAAKTLNYKKDEFTEDETIDYEIPMSVYTWDDEGKRGTLAAVISRKKGGDWVFQLSAAYVGEDWLFFDSVNIRSKTKNFDFTVSNGNKFQKVLGGGYVAEIGPRFLSLEEATNMLDIMEEGDVKFRLNGSGSGSGSNFTGALGAKMKKQLKNALILFISYQPDFTYRY